MTAHHRTAAWSKTTRRMRPIIKASLPAPCVDCGRPVYPEQRWQVGHRIPATTARASGWTVEQINAASNLGPSHTKGPGQKACNQIAGGRLGAASTNQKRQDRKKGFAAW